MIYIRKATLCKNSTEQTREIQEGNKKTGKIQKKYQKKKKEEEEEEEEDHQTTKELQEKES